VQDADETDIDCGGPSCNTCDDGQECAADSDCIYGFCGADSTCSPPGTLIAAWPFDVDGTNVSDPTRPATFIGGATITALAQEVQSGAGAASFLGAPASGALVDAIELGQQFTISSWVRVPDVSQDRDFPILGSFDNQGGGGFDLIMNGAEVSVESSQCRIVWTGDVVGNQSWQHVALVVDTIAETALVYHNGVRLNDTTLFNKAGGNDNCVTGIVTNNSLRLGGSANSTTETGGLDDVRIYNYALSSLEVAEVAAQ